MDNNEKKVLSCKEVADCLGVNRKLVYRQIKAGTIPHVKVGKIFLIPKSAFAKWLLECGNQSKAGG